LIFVCKSAAGVPVAVASSSGLPLPLALAPQVTAASSTLSPPYTQFVPSYIFLLLQGVWLYNFFIDFDNIV